MAMMITTHIALQKKAAAVRFLLSPATLQDLQYAGAESEEKVNRSEFTRYMLIKMGYVDTTVLSLINAAFDKLDVSGDNFIDMAELFDATTGNLSLSEKRMIDELRREHGLSEKDERRLPFGFLGMTTKAHFFIPREEGDKSRNHLGGDADVDVEGNPANS